MTSALPAVQPVRLMPIYVRCPGLALTPVNTLSACEASRVSVSLLIRAENCLYRCTLIDA